MKPIILGLFAAVLSLNMQAQNQNTSTVTKTTTTTIKDSKGEKKIVKAQEINEVQDVKLENEKPGTLNIDTKATPVDVTTKTKVTVDGVTRSVDVNRSAYYDLGGKKYQIALDKTGYTMTNPDTKTLSLLRRTSNNNYIYKNGNKFSVGYFDSDGNLILETYDDKTDSVVLEKYSVMKP